MTKRSSSSIRILHLEDNPYDSELCWSLLHEDGLGFEARRIDTRAAFVEALEDGGYDLILADYSLPTFDGLSALGLAVEMGSELPFILVSGNLGEEVAIEAMKAGATDFVLKDNLSRLAPAVRRALREVESSAEVRQAEAERALLATAIEQSAEAIVITSPDGVISYVNPAFETITGYSRFEAIGENTRLLKSGEHDESFYQELWQTVSGGGVWNGTFVNRRKDGALYHEEATITPVKNEAGEIVAFVASKRDVTEELRREEELAQAQRLEALGQLAGGIAHDFNNLLAAIGGSVDVFRMQHPELAEGSLELDTISNTVQRGSSLTKRLLAVACQQVLELKTLDLNRVVSDELEILRRVIPESVTIDFQPAPDLPTVKADGGQLTQVLMNLAVNARDAMNAQGTITIMTSEVAPGDGVVAAHPEAEGDSFVRLTVFDTGSGMDEATLERIFEPFFTTKPDGEGTGMGLATVYGIVRQHRGIVEARSVLGEGTRFDIYLPSTTERTEEDVDSGGHETVVTGETVLVVEDDNSLRRTLSLIVRGLGYKTLEAADGDAALKLIEQGTAVDLVLTDVIMPIMGGYELFERVGEIWPELPFLFSSGYARDTPRGAQAEKDGAMFISKPFTASQLARALNAAITGTKPEG